ncbi:MAG: hypothetical protein E6G60_00030 [Actinobacteria bacterium]|nr:MAG: hypothetical protein E6G60_00030 [Actinomycetota bacterium]
MLAIALAAGWGLLVGRPLARRARASTASGRAAALVARPAPRRRLRAVNPPVALTRALDTVTRRRRVARDHTRVASQLPATVDLLAVAVSAGCTPYLAVTHTVRWVPPPVSVLLARVPRSCALGVTFADALYELAREEPLFAPLADALTASDRFGAPVQPALARLAAEQRATLCRAAETRARSVPTKLLFPLVLCVLPAFGFLTVVPAVLAGLGRL